MRICLNVPDDLLARADKEAQYKNVNRTQYFIGAVTEMCKADAFKRNNPDIEKMLIEMQEKISVVQSRLDEVNTL